MKKIKFDNILNINKDSDMGKMDFPLLITIIILLCIGIIMFFVMLNINLI